MTFFFLCILYLDYKRLTLLGHKPKCKANPFESHSEVARRTALILSALFCDLSKYYEGYICTVVLLDKEESDHAQWG